MGKGGMCINANFLSYLTEGPLSTNLGAEHTLWMQMPWRPNLGSSYEDVYTQPTSSTQHTLQDY